MREDIEPDTVFVEHDANEALAIMDAEGMNHLCVVDGDLVVGVLSREQLRKSLRTNKNGKLHNIMETRVLVLSTDVTRADALKALNFHNAPYALMIDKKMQIRELVEREREGAHAKVRPKASAPGRFIELAADRQTGAVGDAERVYSARPHIEAQNAARAKEA